jgi:hypothetical protein
MDAPSFEAHGMKPQKGAPEQSALHFKRKAAAAKLICSKINIL